MRVFPIYQILPSFYKSWFREIEADTKLEKTALNMKNEEACLQGIWILYSGRNMSTWIQAKFNNAFQWSAFFFYLLKKAWKIY